MEASAAVVSMLPTAALAREGLRHICCVARMLQCAVSAQLLEYSVLALITLLPGHSLAPLEDKSS